MKKIYLVCRIAFIFSFLFKIILDKYQKYKIDGSFFVRFLFENYLEEFVAYDFYLPWIFVHQQCGYFSSLVVKVAIINSEVTVDFFLLEFETNFRVSYHDKELVKC